MTDTFAIPNRGLVLVPGIIPIANERFRIGGTLLLKRPNGSEVETKIAGIEHLTPSRDQGVVVMLRELGKDDVPIGTEIWSVDK